MGESIFGEIIEGVDIGVKRPLPLLPIEIIRQMPKRRVERRSCFHLLIEFTNVTEHVLEGSIVDQNVDAAHSLDGRVNHLLAILFLA